MLMFVWKLCASMPRWQSQNRHCAWLWPIFYVGQTKLNMFSSLDILGSMGLCVNAGKTCQNSNKETLPIFLLKNQFKVNYTCFCRVFTFCTLSHWTSQVSQTVVYTTIWILEEHFLSFCLYQGRVRVLFPHSELRLSQKRPIALLFSSSADQRIFGNSYVIWHHIPSIHTALLGGFSRIRIPQLWWLFGLCSSLHCACIVSWPEWHCYRLVLPQYHEDQVSDGPSCTVNTVTMNFMSWAEEAILLNNVAAMAPSLPELASLDLCKCQSPTNVPWVAVFGNCCCLLWFLWHKWREYRVKGKG